MQQILVIIGVSGSGKSTFAKQFCAENPNWLRVNRDELRKSMLAVSLTEYWRADNNFIQRTESLVNELHNTAIQTALKKGWNVLVDNTHVKQTYISQLIKLVANYEVEIRFKLIDTSLEESIQRDKNRIDQVGETVIREQFEKLQILKKSFNFQQVISISPAEKESTSLMVQDETLPKCVIVDIDGTVADKGKRIAFDWARVGEDTPKLNIIRLVKILKSEGYHIIFFSGRDNVCRPQTVSWLCFHFQWQEDDFQLFMRNERDNRKDSLIKRELFDAVVRNKYFVDFVIDDRNQVVDMWRMELGLVCLQVDYGDF
ncbi:MAG: 5'-hydroxyl kinase [Cytophagales bacterium]|nr:MAG: 5'-hydroxyl kinase [Cytophagales bacterium]